MENTNLLAELGKVVLAVLGLIVAGFLAILGPVGWIVLVMLVLGAGAIYSIVSGSENTEGGPDQINCPACGARTPAASDVCEYCGESL